MSEPDIDPRDAEIAELRGECERSAGRVLEFAARCGELALMVKSLQDNLAAVLKQRDRWIAAAKADGYPCEEGVCYQEICHLARGEYDYVAPTDDTEPNAGSSSSTEPTGD